MGAQNLKVRCPYVFDVLGGMTRMRVSEEERSCLGGVYTVRSSEKYAGDEPEKK